MVYTTQILLFRALQKVALTVNKEIIRLTVSYLKASEHFVQLLFLSTKFVFIFFIFSLYLFICYSYISYCTGLTVSDYILLEFCVLLHSVGIIFYIYCFIVSFIVSACMYKKYIYTLYIHIYLSIYLYLLNWIGVLTSSLLLKLPPRKLEL